MIDGKVAEGLSSLIDPAYREACAAEGIAGPHASHLRGMRDMLDFLSEKSPVLSVITRRSLAFYTLKDLLNKRDRQAEPESKPI